MEFTRSIRGWGKWGIPDSVKEQMEHVWKELEMELEDKAGADPEEPWGVTEGF